MQFNFLGNDSFKTVPGGVVSLMLFLVVCGYGILKGKYMVNVEKWDLVKQEVQQSTDELTKQLKFEDFKNVTFALQFN